MKPALIPRSRTTLDGTTLHDHMPPRSRVGGPGQQDVVGRCALRSSHSGYRSVLALGVLLSALLSARADERLFTYTYEAEVLPKGGVEFEQWLTHRRGKENGVFSAWDFREELEFGLTDKLTSAVYLNFRNTHSDGVPGVADEDTFEFKGVSSEWKYQLLNPNTKPVGVLAYAEATYNGEEFELEEKIVLQKNFGEKWVLALNATVEQEWEFETGKTERELAL